MKVGKKNVKPQGEMHRYTRRNFLSMVGTAIRSGRRFVPGKSGGAGRCRGEVAPLG